ncbi:hypothetical protein D3C87_2182820 [compost metagenome]
MPVGEHDELGLADRAHEIGFVEEGEVQGDPIVAGREIAKRRCEFGRRRLARDVQ